MNADVRPGFRAVVLGAAAGGGLPQWNCGCENCRLTREGELRPQTQSSLAVSADGHSWALLNASPDIRQQIEANGQLTPRGLRDSPISAIVVTNGDVDHLAGLLVLREQQSYEVVMTAALAAILDNNPIFGVLDPALVSRKIVPVETGFQLLPGMEARLFAVPGKAPLFMEGEEARPLSQDQQTVGIELRCAGRRICYVPGCADVSTQLTDRLRDADLLFFDGTLFSDEELLRAGTGRKTGRRMGHVAMDGPGGSLAALAGLGIGRKVYVHINNTNPVWRQGPERDRAEAGGFEIGYDGMEFAL